MNNYNVRLSELIKESGFSLKELSKKCGVNKWKLYFYENGYFRPTKKDLRKLNKFFNADISIEGDDAYPAPNHHIGAPKHKENLKAKRIIFGSISFGILISVLTGAIMFNKSVSNTSSYYGDSYTQMKAKAVQEGNYGYDMVTSLKYYYLSNQEKINEEGTMLFYETESILYFNETTFTVTDAEIIGGQTGLSRYRYQLGSNLGVNSYKCDFTFGSFLEGTYFSCDFEFTGRKIDHVDNFKILVPGTYELTYDEAVKIVNYHVEEVNVCLSDLMSKTLGRPIDFYTEFLADREQGRVINFSLQISALFLIFPGIIAFFIVFGIFLNLMVKNIKPKLVEVEPKSVRKTLKPLPKDYHINFGIPDMFIIFIGRFLQIGSIVCLVIAFLAKLGVPFFSFFSNPVLLEVFRLSLLAGIFLVQFVMVGRVKNPRILFHAIIANMEVFLFIATMETVVISLTNAWGYDFASLIYSYIPSNVYQVVAVHYLIFLFLFFQPSFLKDRGKWVRILWHSLSFVPFGFLVATYFLSNNYALVYGVKENIFLNFWFPNGFLLLSIVIVFFLYLTFSLRLFFEKKFGQHNAQLFFFGDRYTVFENTICAGLIIIAAAVDLAFRNNQIAYYLGLGQNIWLFTLVPFVLLCRYSPNNQQVFLFEQQIRNFAREK